MKLFQQSFIKPLLPVCLFLLSTVVSQADNIKIGNIYYSITSETTAMVMPHIEGNNLISDYEGDIIIPSSITTVDGKQYSVTAISESAFVSCDKLTSVSLPNTITYIGDEAFSFCQSLKSIVLPESVKVIGRGAFFYVPLKQLNIPKACTHLTINTDIESKKSNAAMALQGLYNLENITVSEGNEMFSAQDGILVSKDKTILYWYPESRKGSFTTPENIRTIGDNAFTRSNLTELTISPFVETIAASAFGSANFEKLTFAGHADAGTLTIKNIYWLTNNGELGRNIKNLTIARNISGEYSKLSTEQPLNVTVSDGFDYNNTNSAVFLRSINPYTIEYTNNSKGGSAYDGAYYYYQNDYYFQDDETVLTLALWPGLSAKANPELMPGCKRIGSHAFYQCTNVKSINIPNSVASIGEYAFSETMIESIEIGDNITSIENNICDNCSALKEIRVYGANINHDETSFSIPERAFSNCTAIENLYIGPKINHIGSFMLSKSKVQNIYVSTSIPPAATTVAWGLTKDNAQKCTLHVPVGSVENYKNNNPCKYFNIVEYDASGVDENSINSAVSITVSGNNLTIDNVSEEDIVEIYNINGQNVYRGCKETISLPKGIYIVKIGSFIRKVII